MSGTSITRYIGFFVGAGCFILLALNMFDPPSAPEYDTLFGLLGGIIFGLLMVQTANGEEHAK